MKWTGLEILELRNCVLGGAPSRNMSKHVITSRDMLCFESREAEMWCFICRFLSSFLSRPWLLVCLKDPVWFSTGTLPPRFCTWIPPKPPIPPRGYKGVPHTYPFLRKLALFPRPNFDLKFEIEFALLSKSELVFSQGLLNFLILTDLRIIKLML